MGFKEEIEKARVMMSNRNKGRTPNDIYQDEQMTRWMKLYKDSLTPSESSTERVMDESTPRMLPCPSNVPVKMGKCMSVVEWESITQPEDTREWAFTHPGKEPEEDIPRLKTTAQEWLGPLYQSGPRQITRQEYNRARKGAKTNAKQRIIDAYRAQVQ